MPSYRASRPSSPSPKRSLARDLSPAATGGPCRASSAETPRPRLSRSWSECVPTRHAPSPTGLARCMVKGAHDHLSLAQKNSTRQQTRVLTVSIGIQRGIARMGGLLREHLALHVRALGCRILAVLSHCMAKTSLSMRAFFSAQVLALCPFEKCMGTLYHNRAPTQGKNFPQRSVEQFAARLSRSFCTASSIFCPLFRLSPVHQSQREGPWCRQSPRHAAERASHVRASMKGARGSCATALRSVDSRTSQVHLQSARAARVPQIGVFRGPSVLSHVRESEKAPRWGARRFAASSSSVGRRPTEPPSTGCRRCAWSSSRCAATRPWARPWRRACSRTWL